MYIQHIHPTYETPEAEAQTLSALYRACVRKLRGPKPTWTSSALPSINSYRQL